MNNPTRRDARVVEWGGLENRCTGDSTQGSNPCLSANDPRLLGSQSFTPQFVLYSGDLAVPI